MTISYPISPPSFTLTTDLGPMRAEWSVVNVVSVTGSPYNLKQSVVAHGGSGWGITVTLPPLSRKEAAPWEAFLASLYGREGTFYWQDVIKAQPQGSAAGSPKIKANTIGQKNLSTKSWTIGATLKKGDLIQVGYSLYILLNDMTADGSGEAVIDVWPYCRGHSADVSIITSNPKCVFRLTDNQQNITLIDDQHFFTIGFSAAEAL